MHLLVVEDDTSLASALEQILVANGHEVDCVHDGQTGFEYGNTGMYDVIIMDVMMPKMDGFEVTRELRRNNINTPIMLLTARDEVSDKISGYDSGADDYMTKPFAPSELLAHLRALGRRQGEVQFEQIKTGDLTLDLESNTLSTEKKSIQLSEKEFDILKILMAAPNAVFSKDKLIDKAWDISSSAGDNNVEAYISFLRKKLKHLGSASSIETIRKAGYRFVENADKS